MVCLCYIDVSGSPTHLRFLLRRLRQQIAGATFVVGFWPAKEIATSDDRTPDAIGADAIAGSVSEMVSICLQAAQKRDTIADREKLTA